MILPRSSNMDKLSYEQRMQVIKNRAAVFLKKPDLWLQLNLQPKGQS